MFDAEKAVNDQRAAIERIQKHLYDPDTSVVNYRFVINDATCRYWEPMPEAGTTLRSLVDFLNTCGNSHDLLGEEWDYHRLSYGGSFDSHVVSYGLRSQFWIPTIPKESDFIWDTQENLTVTCCGAILEPYNDYDNTQVCPDAGYIFRCDRCGKHTRKHNGKVHRTVRQAYDAWNKMFNVEKNSILQ
jgi:hypothetical protein